jgi:MFS family permease
LHRVLAVGIGNALEFYDFLTFSFFAIQIGHTFFPATQTSHGLLYSLATFGVGFATRPLGGILIGRYGDRAGRKPAMMLSFGLMGVAILGLALTPSWNQIGIAAPIILVGFRLIQGFALGGEVGPSTAFMIEAAPPNRRGLYVSLQNATQALAILAAGVVGLSLSAELSPAALDSWGWRVAFLLGLAVVPVGLYVRGRLPETLHQAEVRTGPPPPRRVPTRVFVLGLLMLAQATITTYVISYMTTYAQDSLGLTAKIAFGATVVSGGCHLCVAPVSGILSDRFGRKPVMLFGLAMLVVFAVPCFAAIDHWRGAVSLYLATAALATFASLANVPVLVTITESLPKAVRSGALATIYALAIATFGGTAQFVIKWLGEATGSNLAQAWYLTAALVVGGAAAMMMRESAPVKERLARSPSKAGDDGILALRLQSEDVTS